MCSAEENPEIVWYNIQDVASWAACTQLNTRTNAHKYTHTHTFKLIFLTLFLDGSISQAHSGCCGCHGLSCAHLIQLRKNIRVTAPVTALIRESDTKAAAAFITRPPLVIYSWTASQALPFPRPLQFTGLLASGWARVGYPRFPAAVQQPGATFIWIPAEMVSQL